VVDEVRRRKVPVMAVQFDERGSDAQGGEVTRFDYDYVLGNLTGRVYERPLSRWAWTWR
jgi:hypothetical protein